MKYGAGILVVMLVFLGGEWTDATAPRAKPLTSRPTLVPSLISPAAFCISI
jgi:hypothetical protein